MACSSPVAVAPTSTPARTPVAQGEIGAGVDAPAATAPEPGASLEHSPWVAAGGVVANAVPSRDVVRCSAIPGVEAQQRVAAGDLLLDVRTEAEYAADHLAGAVNVPIAALASRLTEFDRTRAIVVYCVSGSRSARATTTLCDAGFKVRNLGPMSNWGASGG